LAVSTSGDNGDEDDKEFEQKMVKHFEEEKYKLKQQTHLKPRRKYDSV